MRSRCLSVLLLLLPALFCSPPGFSQIAGLGLSPAAPANPAAAKQEPAVPADPLGRETPRGALLGFIKAAQDEHYNIAVQYFQPAASRRRRSEQDDEEIAAQLLTILNEKFTGALDLISRDPGGRLDDTLPPDQERVPTALGFNGSLLLVRLEEEPGHKLWYFSRASLEQVPELYDLLTFPELEKKIPETLVKHRLLSMPLWQWMAILLFIPIAWLTGRLVTLGGTYAISRWRKAREKTVLPLGKFFEVGPITLALAIVLHYLFVGFIGTSLIYRLYYRHIVWIFL